MQIDRSVRAHAHARIADGRRVGVATWMAACAGFVVAALPGVARAQSFHEAAGSTDPEVSMAVCQTKDGGYATAGIIYDSRTFTSDFLVVRYDALGVPLWQVRYGSATANDEAYSIALTADEGFVIAGNTDVFGDTLNVAILRLDKDGAQKWAWTYEGDWWYEDSGGAVYGGQGVLAEKDLSTYVVGRKQLENGTKQGGQLLRVDAAGLPLFNNAYFGPTVGETPGLVGFVDLAAMDPGKGVAIVGTRAGYPRPEEFTQSPLIVRATDTGVIALSRQYQASKSKDQPYNTSGVSIDSSALGADGRDIIIAGHVDLNGEFFERGTEVLRVDGALNPLTIRTYTYPNGSNDLVPSSAALREVPGTGDIAIVGNHYFGDGGSTAWMSLLDADCNEKWFMFYGASISNTRGEGVFASQDNPPKNLGLAGSLNANVADLGKEDLYLLRTDMSGHTGCHEERFFPTVDKPDVEATDVPLEVLKLPGFENFPGIYERSKPALFVFCSGKLCEADINGDGVIDLLDFFDFFNLWDVADPAVDLNNDGSVDLGDFFLFFNLFDSSCL